MVDGAVVFVVLKPGPVTVFVPGLAVAVRTVVVPSTQVIVVPVCEQVVVCAAALPGRMNATIAVETLLSSASRNAELVINKHPLIQSLVPA